MCGGGCGGAEAECPGGRVVVSVCGAALCVGAAAGVLWS